VGVPENAPYNKSNIFFFKHTNKQTPPRFFYIVISGRYIKDILFIECAIIFQERTLDKKFKIRKEAMSGLAMIYRKHLSNPNGVPEATKNAVKWIKAGLEKTRFKKKNSPVGFFGFFGFFRFFFYIFAEKRCVLGFFSFKNTFRCILTLNYNNSY
jgi:hypothetical protein